MENNINNTPEMGGMATWMAPMPIAKPENAFKPKMADFVFALVAFVLGYLYSCWVFFAAHGWGVAAFTTFYLLSVTAYLVKKGVFVESRATWFWLAVTWIAGVSCMLWDNASITPLRIMFLFCSAVYYVITATGRTVFGKTGNYLLLDGINAVIILPFRNFINQYVSFGALKKGDGKRGKTLPVLLGVAVALLLAACLIPLLRRADSGGFSVILDFLAGIFTIRMDIVFNIVIYCMCAVPIAAYLYGLVSGAAHNKGTDIIKQDSAKKTVAALRFLPATTVYIAFGAVCGIYLVFILSQIPYFFSAFTGHRPEGWLIYSEYARQGFFELCGIAVINLVIVTVGNLFCDKQRTASRLLKIFNIALALLTLIFIATAFSKMALYIGAYGLTMPRLLPCVFMVFLAAVFVALIALQKWDFSIVRFALVTGAVMFCALFLCNPDVLVVRYNTNRYLSGTLSEYDTEILFRSGYAGVVPALEVYEKTPDEQLKKHIAYYLEVQMSIPVDNKSGLGRGANEYSIEMQRALGRLSEYPELTASYSRTH